MDCPRCNGRLQKSNLNEVNVALELDVCEDCGGIWFDQGELARIDKIVEPHFIEIRRIPGQKQQLEAMYCPYCYDHPLMQKAEHPRDKKVILDYCDDCKGIWLDKGELEAIQKDSLLKTIGNIFNLLTTGKAG
jgi:Zn-finger nucleic acid-binding protein